MTDFQGEFMFEILEDEKFKGWYNIFVQTPSGEWLKCVRRFSSLKDAEAIFKKNASDK